MEKAEFEKQRLDIMKMQENMQKKREREKNEFNMKQKELIMQYKRKKQATDELLMLSQRYHPNYTYYTEVPTIQFPQIQ